MIARIPVPLPPLAVLESAVSAITRMVRGYQQRADFQCALDMVLRQHELDEARMRQIRFGLREFGDDMEPELLDRYFEAVLQLEDMMSGRLNAF